MRNRKANQGFTLIELLIVIAIIGILAAVLIPNLLAARNRANDTATQAYIRQCVTAVETERNSVTQALPEGAVGSNCEDADALGDSVLTLPAAVESSEIGEGDNDDTFTVTATSTTGNSFTFNGTSIVEAGAPTP